MRVRVLLLLMVELIQIVSKAVYSDEWIQLGKKWSREDGYWGASAKKLPLSPTWPNISCSPMVHQGYVSELFLLHIVNSSI